jgi:Lon protease-like protein
VAGDGVPRPSAVVSPAARICGDIAETELVPLFPLHAVLFPGAVLPLHVFEERYRLLVRERLDFGVVLIRQGGEVGEELRVEDLHPVGTVATFQRIEGLPDGRYAVVVRGLYRFRLLSLEPGLPYLRGHVERLPDPPPGAPPRLISLLERYLAAHGVEPPTLSPTLASRAVWLVGALLQVEPGTRQRLLESGDPALAEALLTQELAKLGGIGRLGLMRPKPPSRN